MTPAFLGLPESLRDRSGWGFAAQLYSVRSRQSWGVGDLADLADLAVWSGKELGADFVLVNPLHAAEPSAPLEPSPYLPTSRRFFNPLYLRVEEVPEYTALSAPARAEVDRLAAEVHAALDGGDVVDRDTAWTAKRAALEILHAVPRSDEREAGVPPALRGGGRGARRLRHLAGARARARPRLPYLAGRPARRRLRCGGGGARVARAGGRLREVAAVGARRAARRRTGERPPGRDGAGHHARPRRRRAPRWRRRVADAVDVRRGDHGGRATGPVQPARTGLEPAAVAAAAARGERLRAVPRPRARRAPARGRGARGPRDRAVPALVGA